MARLRLPTKIILGAGVSGAFFALCFGLKMYKKWRVEAQGSLEPKTQEDIDKRDAEKNVYAPVVKRNLPISKKSKCTSIEILEQQVRKCLVYGTIHRGEQVPGRFNGLFLTSNVLLMNYHYFEQFGKNLRCTLRKDAPNAIGGKFVADLSLNAAIRLPDTDFVVVYCATGGSFPNLVKHLPLDKLPTLPFKMLWRAKDGEVTEIFGRTSPGYADVEGVYFDGGYYQGLSQNTFGGLCGAPLLAECIGSTIFGIHIGGTAGTKIGTYGQLYQKDIVDAIAALRNIEGVVLTGSAEQFLSQIYGIEVTQQAPLHKKSPLNFLPHGSQLEYYGSCIGRAVSKSDVKVTPISEILLDVCGVPNTYCAPEMNPEYKGWQTCLANASIPAHPFPYDLLVMAILDYKEPLLKLFRSALWKNARPLTDHENLCGIPGKKFIDAIKLDTSGGVPLKGKKREYIIELEPTEEKPNNRELDPMVKEEIDRCEDCYKRGERAYPIAKGCKKDEILTKLKCRIFYANALALTFLIRKYFLPVLRVLQMNPIVSECAVGINCHGPEWEQFHQHVFQHGESRLFGGDYGKYDQKLPSQLLLAALRILIDCAKECCYEEEDLRVMETLCGDIVYAVIAFNGDLVGLTEGTHISGNSLTVVLNGICGSLNMRCYYYNQYPYENFDERRKFQDYVAAMTYGDDNIGSVSPEEDHFTIKGMSQFLGEYGQVYTMPDKESELIDFLPPEEFEFLKRKSHFHPALGVHIGALLDKSIFKSLHMFMRPKGCDLTEKEACAINIDGALREWFNHGEEKYERMRKEMIEVAKQANITHMCTMLDESYADRISNWLANYGD